MPNPNQAPSPTSEIISEVPGNVSIDQQPVIDNFAEAKAYKKFQESQEPEAVAAANAMQEDRERRKAAEIAHLTEQAQQLAQNPNAITEVPKNLAE